MKESEYTKLANVYHAQQSVKLRDENEKLKEKLEDIKVEKMGYKFLFIVVSVFWLITIFRT
ncbi:hypothetical protein [Tuberibacillus sp. Marseille-P3662]|uniref:hypothetical protein n=1 Tax=Tuberibacillus sp. Marseille-P3662 TaxID=1965358 RepID=UPI000A1CB484|nr:hypothetical protein [Tuberibacillus sp. Marseille-P3662]